MMPGVGCSGPDVRVGTSRLGRSLRDFRTEREPFPNELARVCDSVGKSPARRGLDAAFPCHFVPTRTSGPGPEQLVPVPVQESPSGLRQLGTWNRNS